MNVKEENICRLCLKVAESDFEIINETTRQMFEFLSLRVNLDISNDPIICKDCAEVFIRCYNFKAACVDMEKHILTPSADKNVATFELKDIDRDEKDVGDVDNNLMCRFCSTDINGSDFVFLNTLINNVRFAEKLQALVPEMDFNIVKNPGICTACVQDLEYYIKFIENCCDVEEKITIYCRNEGTPSSARIKLSEILQFPFNTVKFEYTETNGIKREDISEARTGGHNSELIKPEEPLHIKDEVSFNETDVPVYKSNACGIKTETTKGVNKNVTEARILKCDKCTYQTNRKGNLNNHILIHKDITEVEMYQCSMCTYQTKRKNQLKPHMLKHKHVTEVEMHKCAMCTFETKFKNSLKAHTLRHKAISEVNIYKCSTCSYETKSKCIYIRHTLIHKDVKEAETYRCPTCTYATNNKYHLQSHTLIHKGVAETKMYKCSECAYETKRKGSLKIHMVVHKDVTQVEMYRCSMCPFKAKRKGDLKYHMVRHANITDIFKCAMCSYETKYRKNLTNHTLIHKNVTEVNMYKCSMCTYETKYKKHLARHMLIHKGNREVEMFKCSMCTLETKRKNSLKVHMLTHKGVNM